MQARPETTNCYSENVTIGTQTIYLDPEPCGHGRRLITIEPIGRARKWVRIQLNRDTYADSWPVVGAAAYLKPGFQEAADCCADAGLDRLLVQGCTARVTAGGASERWVTLAVPSESQDAAVKALIAAELHGDLAPLQELRKTLAVPFDDWLAPGEHVFRRGVDFSCSPQTFRSLLRSEADARRDRRLECKIVGEMVSIVVTPESETERLMRKVRRGSRRR